MTDAAPKHAYEFAPMFGAGRALAPGDRVLTPEDLEELRAAAFAEGEAAGRAAAEAETERRRTDALAAIAAGLPQVRAEMEAALARIEASAAALALDVGRALAEEAIEAAPVDALRPTLQACFERLAGAARLTVTVHETIVETVREEIAQIARETGFDGHVRVIPGAGGPADLHVEWGEGGVERRLAEIDEEIARRFAAHGVAPAPGDLEETP